MDLNKFIEWQALDADSRSVKITISTRGVEIWVYDYRLMSGQFVTDVADIDIQAVRDTEDRATFKKLQAKYGG